MQSPNKGAFRRHRILEILVWTIISNALVVELLNTRISMSAARQKTLASSATLKGTSLHTGEEVSLTMKPAAEGHGIRFRRIDLDDQPFWYGMYIN